MRLLGLLVLLVSFWSPVHAQTCACPQADDFAYETDTRAVTPSALALCTSAGCGTVNVQVAHRIITPAVTMPPAMPLPPDPHFLAVEANNSSGFPELSSVTLSTSVGGATITVTPTQPKFLFAPCEKSLVGPPGLPPASVLPFLCSKTKTSPSFKVTFNVTDQFGNTNPLVLDRLAYICQTANVAVPTTTTWLACFSENKSASKLIDPTGPVFINSDFFGAFVFNTSEIHTPDEFCVSATQM